MSGRCIYDWRETEPERQLHLDCKSHKGHSCIMVLESRRRLLLIELLNHGQLQGVALLEAMQIAGEEDPLAGL